MSARCPTASASGGLWWCEDLNTKKKKKKKEIEKNVINKPFLVMLLNVLQSKLKIFAH